MKYAFRLVVINPIVFLLLISSAQAQTIHGYPGKAVYLNTTEWPPIDFQVHWKPGNNGANVCPSGMTLAPGLAHTHIQVTAPFWAELGANDTITLPLVFKLFCTAGEIVLAGAEFQGDWGSKEINDSQGNSRLSIPGQSYPYHIAGSPSGLVQFPASLTFNLSDGLDVGIPLHGWARISIYVRVHYDNGDEITETAFLPFYSMINPSAPERPLNEAGINLAVHGVVVSAADGDTAFQTQLTEFKSMFPILTPIRTPQVTDVFAYNYANLSLFPFTQYQMLIDPDFHMGIPGTVQPTLLLGTIGNIDTLKPATIAASIPPMGLPPNVHRLGFSWVVDTGNGFQAPQGLMSTGERLVTLITFPITIGPNPTDDGPVTSWVPLAIPSAPVVPVVPVPPPPEWQVFTPAFRVNTSGQHQWCDGTLCFNLP